MICKHLNLTTTKVTDGADFFVKHFGFEVRHRGGRDGEGIAVMRNDDDFVLTLMKGQGEIEYPNNFHFGFYVATPEEVEAKHAELTADGVEPRRIQRINRGGDVTTFDCFAPGGIMVEVSTAPDEIVS